MKVKEIYVGFTGQNDPGLFSLVIVLSKSGYEMPVPELVERVIHFPRVIIRGDGTIDPLVDAKELSILIKKSFDKYNDLEYFIETNGLYKPTGMKNLPFVYFTVTIPLKEDGNSFSERINDESLQYFVSAGSNIRFVVKNIDDVDEVIMIITDKSIPKRFVVLHLPGEATTEGLSFVMGKAKRHGFSFSIDYENNFWPNYGRFMGDEKREEVRKEPEEPESKEEV